jgi:NADH-quinone oxidoreductase subunit L
MLFLAFHGDERFRHHAEPGHDGEAPRESPWVITVPLILLAIPSIYAGWAYIEPMLFGNWFGNAIYVREPHAVVGELKSEWHGAVPFIVHGFASATVWLAIAGIATAVYLYIVNPAMPTAIAARFRPVYTLLDNKYYFDRFNDWFFAGGTRWLGHFASKYGDRTIIDGWVVNGSAKLVGFVSREFRRIQSGYVYHYAFVMIVGVFGLLYWWGVR